MEEKTFLLFKIKGKLYLNLTNFLQCVNTSDQIHGQLSHVMRIAV